MAEGWGKYTIPVKYRSQSLTLSSNTNIGDSLSSDQYKSSKLLVTRKGKEKKGKDEERENIIEYVRRTRYARNLFHSSFFSHFHYFSFIADYRLQYACTLNNSIQT